MAGLSASVLALLALLGLIGGIGITAIGPGGVLPTIALFALTGLSPAAIAGTAIVTHIATGIAGSLAYVRSGQLRRRATRRTALLLTASALLGTPAGVLVNSAVSSRVFGYVLAGLAVTVAALLWQRGRGGASRVQRHPPAIAVIATGFGVSIAAAVVGIGGPMLSVPLLIVLATPVLEALAAAQVQSVVIAAIGTIGYASHGAIHWPLAILIGLPELAGVLLGWKLARAAADRTLTMALIFAMLLVAPYLALHH